MRRLDVEFALDRRDARHKRVDLFGEAGVARTLFVEPVEATVDVDEFVFDVPQSSVDVFEVGVYRVEAGVRAVEALVYPIQSAIDLFEALVQALSKLGKTLDGQSGQFFYGVDAVLFRRLHISEV